MEKTLVGLTEKIKINGHSVIARIDTGATLSSVCADLASKLKLGPVIRTATVLSSNSKTARPVIKAHIQIKNRKFNASFTISARTHMKYKVLIGQNILKKGFIIDASKQA